MSTWPPPKNPPACRDKNRYATHAAAAAVAKDQMRRGAPPLRVYQCPTCGQYHLTKRVDTRGP